MRMRIIICEGAHPRPPTSTYIPLFWESKLDQEIELKMAFSLEPPELAKWLLKVYGESYRDDINKIESESMMIAPMLEPQILCNKLLCPTGAKINGELFLEFAEDEDLAKELNLSFAFKRLVKKKAKEVHKFAESRHDQRYAI